MAEHEQRHSSTVGASGLDAAPDRRAPFVWPPRPPGARPAGSDGGAGRSVADRAPTETASRRIARWGEAFERVWFTPTAEPLAQRMRAAGWTAQPFDEYCNRCGQTVGPHETDEFGCSACRGRRLPWDRFARLGPHAGALREWIHEVKFTRWRRLGFDLGAMLGRRLIEAGAPRERVCVIPAPMSFRRRLTRGIDHAAVIASGVASELERPLVVALRRQHRRSQRGLSAAERRKNVVGAFTPVRGVDLRGWNVVVVDDVVTTGATMEAMCRALRKRAGMGRGPGVQVWAAALAAAEWARGGPPTGQPIG